GSMIRTPPAVVKPRAAAEALAARPGAEVPCALRLDRTPNFTGEMQVTLVEPRPGSGVTALPAKIEAGAADTNIVVRLGSELSSGSGHTLRFRAVGKLDGGVTVV